MVTEHQRQICPQNVSCRVPPPKRMKSTKVLNPRRYLILKPGRELVTTCVVDSARANETHSHYGKYTENCWAETETSPKELAGLHGLVSQVAFGLLLAFYNREKPIQSFDVPLLQLQPAGRVRDRSHTARMLAFSLVFTPYLWNAVVSGKSPFFIFMLS